MKSKSSVFPDIIEKATALLANMDLATSSVLHQPKLDPLARKNNPPPANCDTSDDTDDDDDDDDGLEARPVFAITFTTFLSNLSGLVFKSRDHFQSEMPL